MTLVVGRCGFLGVGVLIFFLIKIRLVSGSLIYDFSGTFVIALRNRPHDTPIRHRAQPLDDETTRAQPCDWVAPGRAGARAAEQRDVSAVGGGREWRPPRVAA